MERRATVGQRKLFLRNSLAEQCLNGTLSQGVPAPPLRELAEAYHLSVPVVRQVVQELVEEGYFHIIPRIGTFVGQPAASSLELYLILLPDTHFGEPPVHFAVHVAEAKGFEEQIAQLGGACLALPLDVAMERYDQGKLPPFAGVFVMHNRPYKGRRWSQDPHIPCVLYETPDAYIAHADRIFFDHVEAGKQAVRHLVGLGHRRILYLAVHMPHHITADNFWSAEREQGWREGLCEAGLPYESLSFYPSVEAAQDQQEFYLGAEKAVVSALEQNPDFTAVVAANTASAVELLSTLNSENLSQSRWPAIICFDEDPNAQKYMLSSLGLPLEQAGRVAAELLWQRRHDLLKGPPVERRLPMRLIPRLTTRTRWTEIENVNGLVALDAVR